MDIGKLKETYQVWVQFDEDTEVLIEHTTSDELQKIYRQATVTRFRNHQKVDEYDGTEGNRLLGRKAVKDWRPLPGKTGFTMNGEPFPYSPENCDFLMEKWAAFSRFVNKACDDLDLLIEAEREASRKN